MRRGPDGLLRRLEEPQATYLELFFDVVFVLALALLSLGLVKDLTWSGALQTLVLLLALWSVWFHTSGCTDRLDSKLPQIQLLVLATMVGTLLMAAAVPEAFGEQGLLFAGVYLATQIGRHAAAALLLRGHEAATAFVRSLFWWAVSAVPWIAGALVHGTAREVLWVLAVAVEYVALALGVPTPRLGRAYMRTTEYAISAEHQAERYRQFFIIALGEPILVTGLILSRSLEFERVVAAVVAFVTTGLLWRIYIQRAGSLLAETITAASDSFRALVRSLYAHLVMVAGVVTVAVGAELVVEHPLGHTRPAWIVVVLGGPALFLAGRVLFEYAVFARVSRFRVMGIFVLVAISPAAILLPPIAVGVVPVMVLAGVTLNDSARIRRYAAVTPSPPQ
ncbi:low temperature requirement protein A [Micromonospora krabiensis]|uniref:Low temperature requirement protein LtrA n=1 Tax=Micromonospora krabiensis TaxID=307121 RepID=A0A1C3NED4_9ACTN|nr:low temperature requirement protein A [Micromonospora krabiensis]SBV30898.1 Low temperature requirement protein LtrA [Micromonospora krabiensis]